MSRGSSVLERIDLYNNNGKIDYKGIFNLFFMHEKCEKIFNKICKMFNKNHPHLAPIRRDKSSRQ